MPDVQTLLTSRFQTAVAASFGDAHAHIDPLIRPSSAPQHGDYQANLAMSLAKQLALKPRDVAEKIKETAILSDICDKIEIAGPGFINLRLSPAFLNQQINAMAGDERLGVPVASPSQTVVVDYSSPNVAKEMHVGHLRSTIIGDAIARVLSFQGHRVIRQNHVGDWGTQFGMLIEHLIGIGWKPKGDHSISDLNALYQDAKRHFDSDAVFAEQARNRVVMLQSGDEHTLALWRGLIDESKAHFNEAYARLGVLLKDDDIRGESAYNPALAHVANSLKEKGLASESQGALVLFPDGFKDPEGNPQAMIIRKSDGGYLYATTDLAAARYRINDLHADRIAYVTDARQGDHFAMLFWALRAAKWASEHVRLDHVPFGMVLGPDKRPYKTREGGTVKLASLLDEAVERALAVINEKNPELPEGERQKTARAVGIGALKYADLSVDRVKDYVFDWDRMLSFDGNTAPYIQNAYVRVFGIFRKGGVNPAELQGKSIAVAEPAERALAVKLLQLPAVIESVAQSLEPHRLCAFLYDLAAAYHKFFEFCPVLTAPDEATRLSRLRLSSVTARTFRLGLGLLGIEVVERM
jgi:arginyl-tRNA synthetase